MISNDYNFEKFLDAIKDKDFYEIIILSSNEAGVAEKHSSSIEKGISRSEKERIGYYCKRVGEFAFFMKHGIMPGGVIKQDFELYRQICENLVKKGQLKPSILDLFSGVRDE